MTEHFARSGTAITIPPADSDIFRVRTDMRTHSAHLCYDCFWCYIIEAHWIWKVKLLI